MRLSVCWSHLVRLVPVTVDVAVRPKARLIAVVLGSNLIQSMDVRMCVYSSSFVLSCVLIEASRPAEPRPSIPTNCICD
jgi:hypothetical protein